MMAKASKYLIIVIFFLRCAILNAQQEIPPDSLLKAGDSPGFELDSNEYKPRFGAYVHYGMNLHWADFGKLPNVPNCCENFGGGFGSGFSFGALIDYPLQQFLDYPLNWEWLAGVRLDFSVFNGLLTSEEGVNLIVDGVSVPGKFEHRLEAGLTSIGIEPFATYRIQDRIFAHGGFRIAYVTSKSYEQWEQVVSPQDRGVFEDTGLRTRNSYKGDINEASAIQAALVLGASWEFPLVKDQWLFIVPEVFYKFCFTPVVSGLSWNVHRFQIGAAVKYRQPPPPPPPPPPPLPPPFPGMPPPSEPPRLIAAVSAVKVDSNNVESPDFSIKIEDFISINMRPLLNYIFFDENSAEIPSRYNLLKPNQTSRFDLMQLANYDAIKTYYHVLNIIGKRLREDTKANITITGCNSNTGDEKNNRELSKKRAETVRDYFRDIWGIDETRMKIVARNLPQKSSRSDEPGGDEENRRVEITSGNFSVSEPVITVDTMRTITKTTLKFLPEVIADAGVLNWEVLARQSGKTLKKFTGNSRINPELVWEITDKDTNAPATGGFIYYTMQVTDSLGQTYQTERRALPVEQLSIDRKRLERISDREFEYYSLILFDYGESRLETEHRKVVDFVRTRVTPEAQIYIYGHTDRMGDDAINLRISEQRAREVARRLKIDEALVKGLGKTELLYDNDQPEGRFYCRTVRIIIETPVID